MSLFLMETLNFVNKKIFEKKTFISYFLLLKNCIEKEKRFSFCFIYNFLNCTLKAFLLFAIRHFPAVFDSLLILNFIIRHQRENLSVLCSLFIAFQIIHVKNGELLCKFCVKKKIIIR